MTQNKKRKLDAIKDTLNRKRKRNQNETIPPKKQITLSNTERFELLLFFFQAVKKTSNLIFFGKKVYTSEYDLAFPSISHWIEDVFQKNAFLCEIAKEIYLPKLRLFRALYIK